MAAIQGVLGLPELLEAVVLHLSPKDMTRAMRVNKTWYAVIKFSSAIHQIRIPAPVSFEALGIGTADLAEAVKHSALRYPISDLKGVYVTASNPHVTTSRHPKENIDWYPVTPSINAGVSFRIFEAMLDWDHRKRCPDLFVTAMQRVWLPYRDGDEWKIAVVFNKDGVRLGDVVQAMDRILREVGLPKGDRVLSLLTKVHIPLADGHS